MTPEEARRLLDGTTPGPWEVDYDHAWEPGVWAPDSIVFGPYYDRQDMEQWEAGSAADLRLAASAPAVAAMIAGMREEWGVHYRRRYENAGRTEWGWVTREDAERSIRLMSSAYVCGIVRRYVTKPEEA